MRLLIALVLLCGFAAAQEDAKPSSPPALAPAASHVGITEITIPAGTRIPVAIKNAISTKSSREGDPIYAQSTFPVVVDDHIVIPAGTYVQGKISQIKPAGQPQGPRRSAGALHDSDLSQRIHRAPTGLNRGCARRKWRYT